MIGGARRRRRHDHHLLRFVRLIGLARTVRAVATVMLRASRYIEGKPAVACSSDDARDRSAIRRTVRYRVVKFVLVFVVLATADDI